MNKNASSSSSSNNTRRGRRARPPKSQLAIPPFQGQIAVIRKQRFQASNTLAQVALTTDRIISMYGLATSATTGQGLFSGFKLRSVEIWGPPGTGSPTNVAFEALGAGFSSHKMVSDTSIGSTVPAHVRWNAPDDWLYHNWFDLTGTGITLGLITGPSGSVVDITVEFVLQNGENPPSATVIAGATTGQVYCRTLDNTGLLVPTNYITY